MNHDLLRVAKVLATVFLVKVGLMISYVDNSDRYWLTSACIFSAVFRALDTCSFPMDKGLPGYLVITP